MDPGLKTGGSWVPTFNSLEVCSRALRVSSMEFLFNYTHIIIFLKLWKVFASHILVGLHYRIYHGDPTTPTTLIPKFGAVTTPQPPRIGAYTSQANGSDYVIVRGRIVRCRIVHGRIVLGKLSIYIRTVLRLLTMLKSFWGCFMTNLKRCLSSYRLTE